MSKSNRHRLEQEKTEETEVLLRWVCEKSSRHAQIFVHRAESDSSLSLFLPISITTAAVAPIGALLNQIAFPPRTDVRATHRRRTACIETVAMVPSRTSPLKAAPAIAATGAASPPATSTAMAMSTCTSRMSDRTCCSQTTDAAAFLTSPSKPASATTGSPPAPPSLTTTMTATSTCSSSTT